MHFQYTPFLIPQGVSTVIAVILAIYSWQRKAEPAAKAFTGAMFAAAAWAFLYALEIATLELGGKLFFANLQYICIGALPVFWLAAVMRLIGRKPPLPLAMAGIISVPVITNLLVWTNNLHHLVYKSVHVSFDAPYPVLDVSYGLWFKWIWNPYLLFISGWIFRMLVEAVLTAKSIHRLQTMLLLIATALPLGAGQLYVLGVPPFHNINLISAMFSVSGIIFAYAISRHKLLFIVPFARETVLDTMPDGVLVLDPLNRLLDFNSAARDILQLTTSAVGKTPLDGFYQWESLVRQVENDQPMNELKVTVDEWTFYFKSILSLVKDKDDNVIGKTILLHDITQEVLLMEQLTQLANTDDLTGLHNRRSFFEIAETEFIRARRYSRPLSIALMNIDDFTQINDQFGHIVGDLALKTIALTCNQTLRSIDISARYGGAVFVFLFPETSPSTASIAVERLCSAISQISIPTVDIELHLTAKFGISGFEKTTGATLDHLLISAEKALHQAKQTETNLAFSTLTDINA